MRELIGRRRLYRLKESGETPKWRG